MLFEIGFKIIFPIVLGVLLLVIILTSLPNRKKDLEVMSFDDYMRNFFLSHGRSDSVDEDVEKAKKDPFGGLYSPIVYNGGKLFAKLGFTPNKVSFINLISSCFIFYLTIMAGIGHKSSLYSVQPLFGMLMIPCGFLVLFTGLIDGMDGAVATLTNQKSRSGGWLDGNIDRICDVLTLVCLVPGGYLIIENWGLDFTWMIWTNVILMFVYEYMRAKHHEVGLTRSQPTMGERVTRVLLQTSFFLVYGFNSLVGFFIYLADPNAPTTDPFPLYVGEVHTLMFLFQAILLVIMSIATISSGKWIWDNLKKMDKENKIE